MIDQLRTHNFILCDIGSNYYAFVHRTFLEYFCAWSYIWQLEAQTLSIKEIKTEVFGNHWQDESWHEVLRLIAGMILDPKFVGEIIEYLMAQDGESANYTNLFLAANCLAEVRNRKLINLVANRLLKELKQFAQTKALEADDFTKIFDDQAEELSEKIINAIANNWKNEPNTLIWLKTCIEFDSKSYVPESAVAAIARGWKDDPETLPILQQRAQSDDNEYVRRTAVQELARGWKDDPEMFELLANCAVNDPYVPSEPEFAFFETNPRKTALGGIIEYFPNHPQTKALLLDRSQNDPDEQVRKFAQQALETLSQRISD